MSLSDVTKLNAAISANSELQGKSLEEIMATATGGVFNNAAQVRDKNHRRIYPWHFRRKESIPTQHAGPELGSTFVENYVGNL